MVGVGTLRLPKRTRHIYLFLYDLFKALFHSKTKGLVRAAEVHFAVVREQTLAAGGLTAILPTNGGPEFKQCGLKWARCGHLRTGRRILTIMKKAHN